MSGWESKLKFNFDHLIKMPFKHHGQVNNFQIVYSFFYTFIKFAQKFDLLDNKNVRNAMLRLKNRRIDGLHSELFLKISVSKWQVSGIQNDIRMSELPNSTG